MLCMFCAREVDRYERDVKPCADHKFAAKWEGNNETFDDFIAYAEVIWKRDDSAPYAPDLKYLVRRADGVYCYAWMSSCSCWPDRGSCGVEEISSDLKRTLGPFGVPVNVRNEEFHALCRKYDVEETRED